jgi:hypothetical protein
MRKFEMLDVVTYTHDCSKVMRIIDNETLDLFNNTPTGIVKVKDSYWVRIFYHDHCILSGVRRLDPLYEKEHQELLEIMEGHARVREELFKLPR